MYGYIYKTTNLINNKIYIGQHKATKFEPDHYIGSGLLITEAISKYGFDNFKCELLEICDSKEQLNEREIFYIKLYNSQDKTVGYNIADGGYNLISAEYLEEIRPKLQHTGLDNGNNKYTIEQCQLVKQLLDSGMSIKDINTKTEIGIGTISAIRRGIHWSCALDDYKCHAQVYKKKVNIVKKSKEERSKQGKLNRQRRKARLEQEFLSTPHFCATCGQLITKLIGSGKFCSRSCCAVFSAATRDNTNIKKAAQQRDYSGKNNPNYGKKASPELRQKISEAIKNSEKYINVINSPRFAGHTHSEESKQKIRDSAKNNIDKGELISNEDQATKE